MQVRPENLLAGGAVELAKGLRRSSRSSGQRGSGHYGLASVSAQVDGVSLVGTPVERAFVGVGTFGHYSRENLVLRIRQLAPAMAGLSMVAVAAVAGPATADGQGQLTLTPAMAQTGGGPCVMESLSVNPAGTVGGYEISATRPPTVGRHNEFKLFAVRASATWYVTRGGGGGGFDLLTGLILQGANLYSASFVNTAGDRDVRAVKLGTGWLGFSTISSSNFQGATPHKYLYGLHANGSLYRYVVSTGVRSYGSAPGFSSVKTMTTIAETASYDTLLMTTKGGALYTVRVPVNAPMKPIVKLVRSTGFAAFESLVAQRCGQQSTLLTAFDQDAGTGTVYAVSHAKGTATIINNHGHFPATFGKVNALGFAEAQLLGE